MRHWIAFLVFAPFVAAQYVPGRYIVELSTEPVADHVVRLKAGRKSAEAISHRQRIESEQQVTRQQMAARNATVLASVSTVANALIVQSSEDAAALAATPGVKRVVRVRTVHMLLDRAVILNKITDVWNEIGTDKAGAGVKIAIIDTGIDISHPGFQGSSLTVPDGFPLVNDASDIRYTNNKVIVARSYVDLLPSRDPDYSARDHIGHGTALGMIAAGVRNSGPRATIQGVAPQAWLGSYKVFGSPGANDSTSDDAILKALDDAVADGMDVINLSLGSDIAMRLDEDPDVQAVERATRAGVIVVVAAGNNGPNLNTISSPATAPSAIAVGASTNDRTFAPSVRLDGLPPILAVPGDGPQPSGTISGSIADVANLGNDGLMCSTLPQGSLTGKIALINRGTCTFESKLQNAQQAGAIGGLIAAASDAPEPIGMAVGNATLPAEMVSYQDGVSIRQRIANDSNVSAEMNFTVAAVSRTANLVSSFSAAGPSVDQAIRPDLLAVGSDMYVATQRLDMNGDLYSPDGYVLVDGTSFSTPLVAGAAALLKSARPGLTVDQYRSLLINSAARVDGTAVQKTGAGVMDAAAALHGTAALYPTAVSFGSGNGQVDNTRSLRVTNLGNTDDTFTIEVLRTTGESQPGAGTNTVQLAPGASMDVPLNWSASGMTTGSYEGFVAVTSSRGAQARAPYWYAVTNETPAAITSLFLLDSGRRAAIQRDAIMFRVTDQSGVALAGVQPEVTVVSGDAEIRDVHSYDQDVPGMFGVDLRLGVGLNTIRVKAGEVVKEFAITGR